MVKYMGVHMVKYMGVHMVKYMGVHMVKYMGVHMVKYMGVHMVKYMGSPYGKVMGQGDTVVMALSPGPLCFERAWYAKIHYSTALGLVISRMWVIGPTASRARACCLAIWRSCDSVAANSLPLITLSMLGHAVAGVFVAPYLSHSCLLA